MLEASDVRAQCVWEESSRGGILSTVEKRNIEVIQNFILNVVVLAFLLEFSMGLSGYPL